MNSFSEYMDGVKAEEELKAKTAAFVRAVLRDANGQKRTSFSAPADKKRAVRKKILLAASSIAACAILALGAAALYYTPVNYVSLDINPSVELGINTFDRVVSAQAYNEDGFLLLEESTCKNLPVEEAVRVLVQEAAEQGFLFEDGSTVIALTAEANGEKSAAELQAASENGANQVLQAGAYTAIVYSDCADLKLREEALEAGVSPGKFRLILMLQALDPSITVAQYKEARITELMLKANELMSQSENGNWQNGSYGGTLGRIRTAARQVQAACANGEAQQNQNSEQNQNQDPDAGNGQQGSDAGAPQNQSGSASDQEQNPDQSGSSSGTEGAQKQDQGQNSGTQPGTDGDASDNGNSGQSNPGAGETETKGSTSSSDGEPGSGAGNNT